MSFPSKNCLSESKLREREQRRKHCKYQGGLDVSLSFYKLLFLRFHLPPDVIISSIMVDIESREKDWDK